MQTLVFFNDDGWLEDPQFRHDAWQEAIASHSTSLGYMAWTLAQHEALGTVVDPAVHELIEAPRATPSGYLQQAFPREAWRAEVEELDTRLGYEEWVWHQLDSGVRCFLVQCIEWETDGEAVEGLPTEAVVVCQDDEGEKIAEILSQAHGWLVTGFSSTRIES